MRHVHATSRRALFVVVATLATVVPGTSSAKRGAAAHAQRFDTSTVQTLSGVVSAVDRLTLHKGSPTGVRLMLLTGEERIPVQLGPAKYVDTQAVRLAVGDSVTVRGSRITYNERPALVAINVTRGADTLSLRDESGTPLWRGAKDAN